MLIFIHMHMIRNMFKHPSYNYICKLLHISKHYDVKHTFLNIIE